MKHHRYEDKKHHTKGSMQNNTMAERGVLAQLRELNPYKATGADELSPRDLKKLAHTISAPLTKLYLLFLKISSTGKRPEYFQSFSKATRIFTVTTDQSVSCVMLVRSSNT